MFRFVRSAPLALVAATALFTALQVACGGDDDAAVTDGALYYGGEPAETCTPVRRDRVWAPPQRLHQQVCTAQQIDAVLQGDWLQLDGEEGRACLQCAYSDATDRSWGAFINGRGGDTVVNRGGCIAQLTGDFSSRGCGAAVQKSDHCVDDACAACDRTESAACSVLAESICADARAAASCADDVTRPGAAAETCANDGEDALRRYLNLFCGP